MNFKLLSKERMVWRMLAVLALIALGAVDLWRTIAELDHEHFRPSSVTSSLLRSLVTSVLPLSAALGMFWKERWGVRLAAFWTLLSMVLFEISVVLLGPRLEAPQFWVLLPVWTFLLLTIGPRELWDALWYREPRRKSFFPSWAHQEVISVNFEKGGLVVLLLVIQVLLGVGWIQEGRFIGFTYPPLSAAPLPLGAPPLGGLFVSPAGFQVEVPPKIRLMGLFPNYGDMALLADGQYWSYKESYQFAGIARAYIHTPEDMGRLLAERYGMLPRLFKSLSWFFGDRPLRFFEIKKGDLWEVVSLKLGKVSRTPKVFVCLMNASGAPLGSLEVEVPSDDPREWQWVYTAQRTNPAFRTADRFEAAAKEFSKKGQHDLAALYLGSAVMVAKDKGPYYKKLVEYMAAHGRAVTAHRILREAQMEFGKDPVIQGIRLREPSIK